jgi:NifB/MoaA-like Fe-S oxidoreductase
MLRFERDLFLDSVSVEEVEKELGVEIKIIEPDGYSFVEALASF